MQQNVNYGPLTVISMEGSPTTRSEAILRWTWRTALATLSAIVCLMAALVVAGDFYTAGSTIGYNLGLAGGLMMLSLLVYPLRKRIRMLERLGAMNTWFRYHMFIGIAGPVLVLFHSTFRTKSMNGAIALYAMLLVVGSGVVGRFIYRHVHRGLYGRKLTLAAARDDIRASIGRMGSVFALQSNVEPRLREFYEAAFVQQSNVVKSFIRFLTLSRKGKTLSHALRDEIKQTLSRLGREDKIPRQERILKYLLAKEQIDNYLDSVVRAAQLASWERAFSLWHVVHIPFLYLLVISGIVHVVAVHMY